MFKSRLPNDTPKPKLRPITEEGPHRQKGNNTSSPSQSSKNKPTPASKNR